ncbi:hypothetical protein Thpro_021119 [Acidihalobacter prosperus]|uniref:Methyltransferase domain-containing protein n=2 Tax=Acidihalobacter prosperus TaxID=160660 RepID=A0A1A6C679_9GAMM|nr:hypothetical protein Thpro_021119 [Acidihalobacter prosperus]
MPSVNDLIAHADFEDAQSVFEFGCGTGRFAARLFDQYLPPGAQYLGCDASPVMIALTQKRLAPHARQAQVVPSGVPLRFPLLDQEADRIVSVFALDLLAEADVAQFFEEAHRCLSAQGKVCLASLHRGASVPSRVVSGAWTALFNRRPALVGGCRAIDLNPFIDRHRWQVAHRRIAAPFLVASEVWVLERRTA